MEVALRCTELHKRYGDVRAVNGLSLDVIRGECFGLLGPNGAGKTTTVEILEGLLQPDAGDVEVLGLRWATDGHELRQRLGIQLQETQLADKLSVTWRRRRSCATGLPSWTRASSSPRARRRELIASIGEARVRLLVFFREPEAIFWAFIFPILMTITLGIAFPSGGNEPVVVGVAQGDGGAIRKSLEQAGGFTIRELAPDAVAPALRDGDVHIVVTGGEPPVYSFDPTRAESRLARLAVDDALKRSAGRQDPWQAREERLVIPGSRYVDWLIPGLLGVNIMTTGVWGIGFSIVQARWRKLLKRLVASPMRKRDYLLAQILARLVFLVGEVIVLVAFGTLVLGMPVRGSWGSIALMTLLGALSFGGFGLLVASRARTFEGISGLVNAAVLQPFIQVLPLTALNDGLRAVMLEGASLAQALPDLLILTAWGLLSFSIALKIFRWT